jgi:hypothetical protein
MEKGYRMVVESKTSVRELREVTSVTLEGEDVVFSCAGGSSERAPIGVPGFRKARRKMWWADVRKRWGSWKIFLVGLVTFAVIYFAILVAVEYAISATTKSAVVYSGEEYSVSQPITPEQEPPSSSAEGWRP